VPCRAMLVSGEKIVLRVVPSCLGLHGQIHVEIVFKELVMDNRKEKKMKKKM
jgi:hypothetical protein